MGRGLHWDRDPALLNRRSDLQHGAGTVTWASAFWLAITREAQRVPFDEVECCLRIRLHVPPAFQPEAPNVTGRPSFEPVSSRSTAVRPAFDDARPTASRTVNPR